MASTLEREEADEAALVMGSIEADDCAAHEVSTFQAFVRVIDVEVGKSFRNQYAEVVDARDAKDLVMRVCANFTQMPDGELLARHAVVYVAADVDMGAVEFIRLWNRVRRTYGLTFRDMTVEWHQGTMLSDEQAGPVESE